MKHLRTFAAALTLSLIVVANASAATLTVTSTVDSGAGSLRQAIADAVSGDTITFDAGLSGQTILLTSGQLLVHTNLAIDASSLPGRITISGNNANRVFLIGSDITIVLTALTITNGQDFGDAGGGIYNISANLTMNQCTVSGNKSSGAGGGICNLRGALTMFECIVTENNTPSFGGGIFNSGGATLALNRCTISRNTTGTNDYGGGGISNEGMLTVNQSTIAENSTGLSGGGIDNFGILTIVQSTIASNTAAVDGGGIGGSVTLISNSIVCSNSAQTGPNISGSISAGANNLVDVNALLAPLGNYGGPTPTMPPLPGSPAIDAAIGSTLTADQRGFLRPVDGDTNGVAVADIGAVEFTPLAPLAGSYNGLFFETAGVVHESSGFFTAKLSTAGKFSSKFILAGKKYSLSGQFDGVGYASNSIPRTGLSPLTVRLFSIATNEIYGLVSDGNWTATLNSDRAVFNKLTNPCPLAGKYTMHIFGNVFSSSSSPRGSGFGRVTLDAAGKITFKGVLADGTKISQKTLLSEDRQWPLYVPIKSGGSILSWVSDRNLVWTKKANPLAKTFPLGFTNVTEISVSRYVAPAPGTRILDFTDARAFFTSPNFGFGNAVDFMLGTDNKVTSSTAGFSLKFKTSTGLFSGKIIDPVTLKPVPFAGAVNQEVNGGSGESYGFFLEGNHDGAVFFDGN